MTEQIENQPKVPSFQIQRIYLKGSSLEMPNAPSIFLEPGEVQLAFSMSPLISSIGDGMFEVVLRGTLTAKLGEKVVYLLEANQAGIFEILNIPQEDLDGLLNVNCVGILAPYIRAYITDTLQRAQVAQFILPEINWAQVYQDQKQAKAVSEATATAGESAAV